MANSKSAKKRIRRNTKAAIINRDRRSVMRSSIRIVEEAITSGDATAAQEAFKVAQPKIHRSVTKGILHKKTAARKLSRLSARIKALKTKAA